jgi:N-acetylmuramoyl-L-alanine amidase
LRPPPIDSIDHRVRWLFLSLLLLPQLLSPARAAQLDGIAITPGIVTISADGPPAVAFQFALGAPYRLVIDMPAAIAKPFVVDGAGSVLRLRAAMFAPGMARLVLDLSRPLAIVAARSSDNGLTITLRRIDNAVFAAAVDKGRQPLPIAPGGPVIAPIDAQAAAASAPAAATFPAKIGSPAFELPADMFPAPPPANMFPAAPPANMFPAAPPPGAAPPAAAAPDAGNAAPDATEPAAPDLPVRRRPAVRPRSGKLPLVVIDAGHGGKDVGSISINGRYEKDATLAMARATARALQRSGKVRVQLTRDDDRFIPLGGRVAIARAARADLFISIHADSAPNALAQGASVYTLSAIASDAVAARLAARENKADIIGGLNLGVMPADVGDIMIDLSRRATGNVSVAFADTLQDSLSDQIRFRGEFHHFAGFIVLKAPDVPSVLFETGYISNADDAEFLFSGRGQGIIAKGIARAIERHLLGE